MDSHHDNRLRDRPQNFSAERALPAPEGNKAKPLRVKIFKSGNSLALRLPASLGLEAGMEMELTPDAEGGYSLKSVAAKKKKFNIDKVWGCAKGSALHLIKPEDRGFEARHLLWDDPEWRAKYMPGE